MKTDADLKKLLLSIDRRSYPAYKETRGTWRFPRCLLSIDHVQGDPFASPSHVSIRISGKQAGFPEEYRKNLCRRTALEDHLLQLFARALPRGGGNGSGKSGQVFSSRPGQEVFSRTALNIRPEDGELTVRFEVGFPAFGRSINAQELIRILFEVLPRAVESSLYYANIDRKRLEEAIFLADDQEAVRSLLPEMGLCAFVADGSILPRESGVSQLPMKGAIPFRSPEESAVTLHLPHRGHVRGLGIRTGVTLIVGGGYHGKSTLLQALERGVYNHIAGDGRELVITSRDAMKIRAEDGRAIKNKDISLFIRNLPNGADTTRFSTEDASGSTSQAAAVSEAMEAKTSLLLIDEDTSATNFMVRDRLMARIVLPGEEPITPFLSRIRDLYEKSGISTILVAGSSGAYFYAADTILQMDRYVPKDITKQVKDVLAGESVPEEVLLRAGDYALPDTDRPYRINAALRKTDRLKIKTLSVDSFLIDHDEVNLRGLSQIADREQTQTLAAILRYMELHLLDGKKSLSRAVSEMTELLQEKGLEILFDGSYAANGLCEVRPQEIFCTLNRYRK